MTQVTIDVSAKLAGLLVEHAVVEKSTRDSVTLRFGDKASRESFCSLLAMVQREPRPIGVLPPGSRVAIGERG